MKEPWYMAGFFVGAGCTIGRDENGKQICDLNNETGVKVGEALRQIVANPAFLNLSLIHIYKRHSSRTA